MRFLKAHAYGNDFLYVEKHAFRPWRVIFPLSDGHTAEIGRLIAIADRVIGAELRAPSDLHIVFTRLAHA